MSEAARPSGLIDYTYLRGVPAILRGLEVLFTFIAFLCARIPNWRCYSDQASIEYFIGITITVCVVTIILWVWHLFQLHARLFTCKFCPPWLLIELAMYIIMIILLFFGALFMALHACHDGHKAGCAFAFFGLAMYIIDAAMSFRVSCFSFKRSTTTTTTTETTTHTVSNAEHEARY